MHDRLKAAIQDWAERHNADSESHNIDRELHAWLYLDRVNDGYARKLAHMWHGSFRVVEVCGEHAVRLEIAGTPYRLFPVVHISKTKRSVNITGSP